MAFWDTTPAPAPAKPAASSSGGFWGTSTPQIGPSSLDALRQAGIIPKSTVGSTKSSSVSTALSTFAPNLLNTGIGKMANSTPAVSTDTFDAGKFIVDVGRSIPRSILSTALTAEQVVAPKAYNDNPTINPGADMGKAGNFWLGSEPITSLQQQALDIKTAHPKVPSPLIALGVAGGDILNLLPFGGEVAGAKAIVAAKDLGTASEIAAKIGVHPDLIPTAAQRFVAASTPSEAKAAIQAISDLQRTTTAPAARAGTGLLDELAAKPISELTPHEAAQVAEYKAFNRKVAATTAKTAARDVPVVDRTLGTATESAPAVAEQPVSASRFKLPGPLAEARNIASPTSASAEAMRAADTVRVGKSAIENANALDQYKYRDVTKLFDKQTEAANIGNISEYEKTGEFKTGPEGYGQFFKDSMDTSRQVLRDVYGENRVGYIENYVRRAFKFGSKADEAKASSYLSNHVGSLSASKSPLKSRVLDMPLDEALANMRARGINVKPASVNPEVLRQWSVANARQAQEYAKVWQNLKDSKLITFVKGSGRVPDGLVPLNDRAAEVFRPTEAGFARVGQYYADPNVARVLNNAVSKGLGDSATYTGIRALNNTINQFQLGLSAFHLTGTGINAGISDMALGLKELLAGNVLKAGAPLGRSLVPFASFARDAFRGNQFIKDLVEGNPIAEKFLREKFNPAGGRLKIDQTYQDQAYKKMIEGFKSKSVGGIAKGAIRVPQAIVETVAKPLMGFAIPRVKIGAFMDLANSIAEKMPGATDAELQRAYSKAWDSVDNRFGMLVYDNLFWNKVAKDLAMVSTRSVGWNLGTVRELGGGIGDVTKILRGKGVSDRTLYAIALPIYAGTIGAVYQYLHTGKMPGELKDYFYPKNGLRDVKGIQSRVSLPTYMKDVFAYSANPLATIEHKASPLMSMVYDLANNSDYYGNMIQNPQDSKATRLMQVGQYISNAVLPFTITQAARTGKSAGSTIEQKGENFMGFTPAPASISRTDQQTAALNALNQEKGPIAGKTPEGADTVQAHSDLRAQAHQLIATLLADPATAAAKFDEINQQNPGLAKEIASQYADQQKGITYEDNTIKAMGITDGTRATYIASQLKSMPDDQKAAYYQHLIDIKLITQTVSDQIAGQNKPGAVQKTTSGGLLHEIGVYAQALGTDPITAFNRIFTGQKITRVDNGTIIVERMPLTESEADKKKLGGDKTLTLDHIIPLELGGSNSMSNLKLVPKDEAAKADVIENYLGEQLRSGALSKAEAQRLMVGYKNGTISASDIMK